MRAGALGAGETALKPWRENNRKECAKVVESTAARIVSMERFGVLEQSRIAAAKQQRCEACGGG